MRHWSVDLVTKKMMQWAVLFGSGLKEMLSIMVKQSVCRKTISCKLASTSAMINHLKRFHGSLTTYDAARISMELSDLRDTGQKSSKRTIPIKDAQPNKKSEDRVHEIY